jgi:ABC-type transporter Mla maintaining outer membrane lipid asymmetry ATPase subunit MlaF
MEVGAVAGPTEVADQHARAPDVHLAGVRKTYGDVVAVDSVNLRIDRGEFFTLLGPSGSGRRRACA